MSKQIIWEPKKVKVSDLKENPNNPKITSEQGRKNLQHSLEKFGLAGTIVCNKDLSIIDGHSRKKDLEDNSVTEVWVSVPSRQLTKKEYDEFNAIFDIVKASSPDMEMIEETLSEETLEEWGLAKDKDDNKPKDVELIPFKRTHILLSFPPEKLVKIQPLLQKICEHSFVEYEQSAN
jgi:hypothetical protein